LSKALLDDDLKIKYGKDDMDAPRFRNIVSGRLNDSAINIYAQLVAKSANTRRGCTSVLAVSSFFYSRATNWPESVSFSSKRWLDTVLSSGVSPETVLVPINLGNEHWITAAYFPHTGLINLYDSLPSSDEEQEVIREVC
jgi:Ulp1 family protease